MMRRIGACLFVFAVVGCNAILDNKPGVLLESSGNDTSPAPDGGNVSPPVGNDDAGAPDTGGCAAGQMRCDGTCVSITDPLYGCGSPSCTPCTTAHASAACQGRRCVVAACDKGFADCNQNGADGCETDLSRPTTCGACNAACPANAPLCAPAGDSFQCGTGCTAAAPLLCGAACVDPLTNPSHCGTCDRACPAVENGTPACAAGNCTFTCAPNFRACPTKCAVPTDPTACGPTCKACPVPPNTQAAACKADDCAYTACTAGFGDCNAAPADGCEINLMNDPAHCGTCNKQCKAGEVCNAGNCEAAAPPPPPP